MRRFLLAGWLFILGMGAATPARAQAQAQALERQALPFSVWLDFTALVKNSPTRMALPIWLESITSEHPRQQPGDPQTTVFRLRLRRSGMVSKELHLRLLFQDDPVSWPSVTGWTETGALRFSSGPLGAGLGLPNSASLLIPVDQIDYIDITAIGDGSAIRGAFVSSATKMEVTSTIDLAGAGGLVDPFGKMAEARAQPNDTYLFGRVRAALLAEPTKVVPESPVVLDFQLDRQPLLAVVAFEVLDTDIAVPPRISVNATAVGAVSLQLPDLADPAYRGDAVPRRADLQYRYTGWLHCEKIVPASILRAGVNQLTVSVARGTQPVAIRALEIQLKYEWEGSPPGEAR